MSKRKGVSADEKRTRMLDLFYEKKEFFQLKELEKIAPKEKGIVAQSVKEVVQGLVDDNLVDTDKIGTSIYFWAFPSKANNQKKRQLEEVNVKLDECKKKHLICQEAIVKEKAGRKDDGERTSVINKLNELKEQQSKLLDEIKKYSHADPDVLNKMQSETVETKEAINRWTDNLFAVRCWCKTVMGSEENAFNQQFGVPPELDYVDLDK